MLETEKIDAEAPAGAAGAEADAKLNSDKAQLDGTALQPQQEAVAKKKARQAREAADEAAAAALKTAAEAEKPAEAEAGE
ncbi:unnamed protein product [Effrenium voratum]|nr:unnamed protein product [Effrenium voratum]